MLKEGIGINAEASESAEFTETEAGAGMIWRSWMRRVGRELSASYSLPPAPGVVFFDAECGIV